MLVGFVGSRSLPASYSPFVSSLVSAFLARGFRVASGGAVGADQFALSALLEQGASSRGAIYSAWDSSYGFPVSVRDSVVSFLTAGGDVVWGSASSGSSRQVVVPALLARNRRLVSSCSCLVAFLHGQSRGSLYTVRQAVRRGIPVYVFLCGGGASLPPDLARHCLVFNKEVI